MKLQKSFEDFKVYKDAINLTVHVYTLLKKEQFRSEFGLSDQLRRATLSISNNIAEGFERETDKELIRYLYFSKGSAGEVRNILNVINAIGFINEDEYQDLREKVIDISKQLSNYIKYVVKRDLEKR
ncbi:MAG: four helix bundle protein [Gillisia sp.]